MSGGTWVWRDQGYEEVLQYFKKSENFISDVENKDTFHGEGGELSLRKIIGKALLLMPLLRLVRN